MSPITVNNKCPVHMHMRYGIMCISWVFKTDVKKTTVFTENGGSQDAGFSCNFILIVVFVRIGYKV